MHKIIDLFAGVGGFHSAFHGKAECVFASEWDSKARETYLANWGTELTRTGAIFETDITKVNYSHIPDFDILCAGFPCQPFSIAGKQAGFTHPTQGTLFFNIINIIQIKSPKVVFLENVKNLKSHDKGRTFKVIKDALIAEGYHVHDIILNAATHGNLPQNRERIFIVAFKDITASNNFSWPTLLPLTNTIQNCLEVSVAPKYYQTNMASPSIIKMHSAITKTGVIYQYRRYYVRENMGGVCPTLTANMGTGGHNVPLLKDASGIRKLTPRECFNFQGYPSSFILPSSLNDSALYKQAGNTVPVTVISRIADEILKVI